MNLYVKELIDIIDTNEVKLIYWSSYANYYNF